MLLEFKFKNYKSFIDETVFSMIPAPKIKDLDFSILKNKIKGQKNLQKALSSAIIYGPNAAGKSNILGAIDTLRSIVNRGHIRNLEELGNNHAASRLELIPNNLLKKAQPVFFSIKFVEEDLLFEYKLKINLGLFLEKDTKRKILEEILLVNNIELFKRTNRVELLNLNKFKDFNNPTILVLKEFAEVISTDSLNPVELFLTNGFKTIVSAKLARIITEWFSNKLTTIYNSCKYEASVVPADFDPQQKGLFVQDAVEEAAKALGITSNHIGYVRNDNNEMVLSSAFKKDAGGYILPSEFIESVGTLRFLNFIYPLLSALKNGGTLIVDEFDNSLHSMVIMNIINIFHNDDINVNNAQLIFNSQNPVFLNSELYRRDEIKFVERNDEGYSSHYSLSDFILPCNKQVRKGADYMKNYFIDRYGAIKNVDLSSIFANIVKSKEFHIHEMR